MLILIRHWKTIAAVLLFILWTVLVHNDGAGREDAKWSARWHQHVAEDATYAAAAATAAREQEQKWAAAFDAAASISHEEMKNVSAHRDRLLAALRAGKLHLPSCPAAQVPGPAANPGEPQDGAEGGQPGMAGEELVARLATCDEVTLERNQAIELLRAERQ